MSYPINQMGGGKKLPTLSNPAAAAQILAGYEAINGEGKIVEGTYVEPVRKYRGTIANCGSGNNVTIDLGFTPSAIVGWCIQSATLYFVNVWTIEGENGLIGRRSSTGFISETGKFTVSGTSITWNYSSSSFSNYTMNFIAIE